MIVTLSDRTIFNPNMRLVKPARKIPRRFNGVRGDHPSIKNGRLMKYESLLEKRVMLMLEFEPTVAAFVEQPITIFYRISEANVGVRSRVFRYTPDLMVYYHSHVGRSPSLIEVKTEIDLAKNKEKYAAKFEAARLFGERYNLEFEKRTELCTPDAYCNNANDYYHDLKPISNKSVEEEILRHVRGCGDVGITNSKLHAIFREKLGGYAMVRHLIAKGALKSDWSVLIDDHSRLFSGGDDV